ncbi:MAG: protein kinase, partial [Salinibacter sp.]|uniref:protein kinase domain-containing protein n=1 Tax=Salinibacter sp. TaxID=2065818 RepID=UPI0035D4A8EF
MDDSIVGSEIDVYRIQGVLGRGGMGVVYEAEDVALSRTVALKRIAPSLANDESFLRRFRSEAQALARIDSPYIVSVHALRQTEIGLLIVMEHVEGGTLEDLSRSTKERKRRLSVQFSSP